MSFFGKEKDTSPPLLGNFSNGNTVHTDGTWLEPIREKVNHDKALFEEKAQRNRIEAGKRLKAELELLGVKFPEGTILVGNQCTIDGKTFSFGRFGRNHSYQDAQSIYKVTKCSLCTGNAYERIYNYGQLLDAMEHERELICEVHQYAKWR